MFSLLGSTLYTAIVTVVLDALITTHVSSLFITSRFQHSAIVLTLKVLLQSSVSIIATNVQSSDSRIRLIRCQTQNST